jgi:hypothetical protein
VVRLSFCFLAVVVKVGRPPDGVNAASSTMSNDFVGSGRGGW